GLEGCCTLRGGPPDRAAELRDALLALLVLHVVEQQEVIERMTQVPLAHPVEDTRVLLAHQLGEPLLPVGDDRLRRDACGDRPAPGSGSHAPAGDALGHARAAVMLFAPEQL